MRKSLIHSDLGWASAPSGRGGVVTAGRVRDCLAPAEVDPIAGLAIRAGMLAHAGAVRVGMDAAKVRSASPVTNLRGPLDDGQSFS